MGEVFNGDTGSIIRRIREIDSIYHAAAVKAGVSDGELGLWLALLKSEKEFSQKDICDLFSLPRQTVNSLVYRLKRKGLIRLSHFPGGRNRKIICLTDKGRSFGMEQVAWIFEAEQKAREESEPRELQACISMLEKYICRLRKEIDER